MLRVLGIRVDEYDMQQSLDKIAKSIRWMSPLQ